VPVFGAKPCMFKCSLTNAQKYCVFFENIIFASKKSVSVPPENKRDLSLTRLVQEGFLLHYFKVSGPVWPVEAPPDMGSSFPQPWGPGLPSLRC